MSIKFEKNTHTSISIDVGDTYLVNDARCNYCSNVIIQGSPAWMLHMKGDDAPMCRAICEKCVVIITVSKVNSEN